MITVRRVSREQITKRCHIGDIIPVITVRRELRGAYHQQEQHVSRVSLVKEKSLKTNKEVSYHGIHLLGPMVAKKTIFRFIKKTNK